MSHLPTRAERLRLKDCDSQALLYGIGRARDAAKARRCAFAELAAAADQDISYHGDFGAAVLATVYANGDGVPRNLPLARHYVCHRAMFASVYDQRMVLEHLTKIEARPSTTRRLDICEHTGSSAWSGSCVQRETRLAGARRDAEVKKLSRGWSPAQRAALARLERAEHRFLTARMDEVDSGGLIARARILTDLEYREVEGHGLFKRLARPGGLSGSHALRVRSDARLNRIYRERLREPVENAFQPGPEAIRKAERAWIVYRDAWLALAVALGRSKGEVDGLATELTDLRSGQLGCSAVARNYPEPCTTF